MSESAAVATKFTFDAPVYIPQSIEHCFVLLSDSNSYQIWILEWVKLISLVTEQSLNNLMLVFCSNHNASTWTADQYEDLKFIVNRAEFSNTVNSKLVLNNTALARGNGGTLQLRRDGIQTFSPELVLTMNSTTLPYTVGARIYQKTTLAEATISAVQTTVGGVLLTINDISGNWSAGSSTGGVITNRVVSSKDNCNHGCYWSIW